MHYCCRVAVTDDPLSIDSDDVALSMTPSASTSVADDMWTTHQLTQLSAGALTPLDLCTAQQQQQQHHASRPPPPPPTDMSCLSSLRRHQVTTVVNDLDPSSRPLL